MGLYPTHFPLLRYAVNQDLHAKARQCLETAEGSHTGEMRASEELFARSV